ncbi:ABC transporter substrate-binding protein [Nocardioides renjunii]|uniref:ABC transporter substrate-binding protein n=1 Tax=Nocardioides renjunii TaxID=3095075 RepID=UPI002AFF86E4|nr:extracellular solute-binding protein [Nocardioides sp. S-34]WQQ22629.1 extracellular solute-binding protein [Nocardioides sp. S-34]
MRRSHILGLPTAAVLLVTTACTGTGGGSSDDGGDPQSITWLIEEPEDAEALQDLKDHVATFTEESGIEVEVNSLPLDNMRTVLQTQLRSGEGPDVFSWGSGPGFGGALAEAGLLHDLTQEYEDRGWEVYDFARDRVTFDGKVYGVPGEMETIGIFYNKDALADLGLSEPQSLEDLEAASEAIAEAGTIPMAVGDKEGWEGGHLLSMALSSTAGPETAEAVITGEESWDSPEVAQAFELWRDYNEQGFLPESPTSVDYDTSISMFYSGEAAMIPTGSWLVGEIDDNVDFEVGFIPFPAPDGPGVFTGGLGSGPYVSAGTSKTEAAVEFVDFLASPEHGEWTVENLHTIPPVPVDTEGLDVSPLFAQVLEDTATLGSSGEFGQNIDVLVSDAVNEAMYDGFQGVLTGQTTPEDAASGMAAAADQ